MAKTKCTKKKIPQGAFKLYGDSIMQLNDGRLLCYYLRKNGKIKIYNKNTFEKTLKIDLIQILEENIFNEAEKNNNNKI